MDLKQRIKVALGLDEENNVTLQYHEIKIRTKKNGEKENYEPLSRVAFNNAQKAQKKKKDNNRGI